MTGVQTCALPISMDTANSGTVAAAVISGYSANPSALGTVRGTIATARMILSTAAASVGTAPIVISFEKMYMKPVTLRGPLESLCINYGGLTAAGNSLDISIAWTEE